METALVRKLLPLRINQLPIHTRTLFVGAHTSISDILEMLEDGIDLWSLLRSLVPALLGDFPDRRGHPFGFKATRLRWSFAFRDHNGDVGVRGFRKGHPSGRELEIKTIRA